MDINLGEQFANLRKLMVQSATTPERELDHFASTLAALAAAVRRRDTNATRTELRNLERSTGTVAHAVTDHLVSAQFLSVDDDSVDDDET